MSSPGMGFSQSRLPETSHSWQALKHIAPGLKPRKDWHTRPMPAEIQRWANDETLPPKLEEILKWSLKYGEPEPEPVQATLTQNNTRASIFDLEKSDIVENTAGSSPVEIKQQLDFHRLGQSTATGNPTTISCTTISRRSRGPFRSDRRQGKGNQHSLGGGVLASTLDLISTFKPQFDLDGAESRNQRVTAGKVVAKVECTSCFDEFSSSDTKVLPCNHSYCKPCLKELVLTAMQNESSYPPKCCLSTIPSQTALVVLDKKQRELYQNKVSEYSIPAQERLYCPNSKCLKWVPLKKIQRVMGSHRCPHCSTKICIICRGAAHKRNEDCPHDFGLEATLALADDEGWSRCFKCRALVERTEGCRHMTCKCGAQFCYYCGAKWRSCECSDYEQPERIMTRRTLRQQRNEEAAAEAAELARAIEEIEEMERAEEQQRILEAERLAAERRREEEELRRLELLRLQEVERRRMQKEREDEELRRIVRLSLIEQLPEWQNLMREILLKQQIELDNRHAQQEASHLKARDEAYQRQRAENEEAMARLKADVHERLLDMQEKQRVHLLKTKEDYEHGEDDMFLHIQLHLRGKPNKEAREKRLLEEFNKQRDTQLRSTEAGFEIEINTLKQNALAEHTALEKSSENKMAELQRRFDHDYTVLLEDVVIDRTWFDHVSERRQNMLSENHHRALADIDAGLEPVGLNEAVAKTIGPFPADHTREPVTKERVLQDRIPSPASSSTYSTTSSLAELASHSNRLQRQLEISEVCGRGANEPSPNEVDESTWGSNGMTHPLPTIATSHHDVTNHLGMTVPSNIDKQVVEGFSHLPHYQDGAMSRTVHPPQPHPHPRIKRKSVGQCQSPAIRCGPLAPGPTRGRLRIVTSIAPMEPSVPGSFPVSPAQSSRSVNVEEEGSQSDRSYKFIVIPPDHTGRQSCSDTSMSSRDRASFDDSSSSVRTFDSSSSVSASRNGKGLAWRPESRQSSLLSTLKSYVKTKSG
ncbi:hypothetical protein PV10_00111 [Exophiala mesophila]|uniref:RBR-type E3 ubiquitin transferase n=1 Tax=Exophiala mesophila TaxID=212818 RepID=A0A0D1X360_EXOME|nr:uncharacterized protein PV10_00111 [Exophiala mesophila]KIV96220.1 hypothetical protein PV10_00111 [Exophiala mesophila]